jgi:hypothetical protein
MTNSDPKPDGVDLTPHPRSPMPDSDDAADGVTQLVGYVGESRDPDQVRIYADLDFNTYYEVARSDVIRTKPVDESYDESPTVVLVRSSADVALVSVSRIKGSASYLSGGLRNRYRATPAGDAVILGPSDIVFKCWPTTDPFSCPVGSNWCYSVPGGVCPPPGSGPIFACAP